MAATRLIPMHVNKGKTLAQSLGDRTDYAKNPEKTDKGELVTGYQCDPMTVDEEFMLFKRQYEQITGRRQRHEVIAYQIRQSFKPGEITPEEANRLGQELALRFTKGKYAFIVATHTDRPMSIITSFSIPLPLTEPESLKTSGYPALLYRESAIWSAWRTAYPLLLQSHTGSVQNERTTLAE